MNSGSNSKRDSSAAQSAVDRYFDSQAPYWRDVYRQEGLQGLVYRERMQTVLQWIDDAGMSAGAAALEVGSGAGLLTVELAKRELRVTSTDASSEMVALTARQAEDHGVADAIEVGTADAHRLPFAAGRFELVVAVGVVPWLADPGRAVADMARVLAPEGLLVLSADNRARLNSLLGQNPILDPFKALYRAIGRARGRPPETRSRLYTPRTVDRWVRSAGLDPVNRTTIGFGPLTLMGRPLLSEAAGLRLNGRLQALSRREAGVIRWMGAHYLVAARRDDRPQLGV